MRTRSSFVENWFAETIPDQHRGIQQILRETPTDLVLIDTMFFGSFPMLLGQDRSGRMSSVAG